jgi:hypothetical protein
MKRFSTPPLAGWFVASDAETASRIDRVIADLQLQARKCERATSKLESAADRYWQITDRH